MNINFGLIELLFFYGIAIGVAYWQWAKMRREVRKMRAERLEREAKEREEATPSDAASPEASDKAA